MAKLPGSQPLRPSILDRLVQQDATRTGSSARRGVQGLRELKESIRRDLEDLLNTRWRAKSWPPHLEELEVSLVNYGIPDFTGANLGSPDNQEEFRRIIQRVIQKFEPRFKSVSVKLLKSADPLDRTLRFRIDGTINAEPTPEPVVFDSSLEPLTTSFEVKEGSR